HPAGGIGQVRLHAPPPPDDGRGQSGDRRRVVGGPPARGSGYLRQGVRSPLARRRGQLSLKRGGGGCGAACPPERILEKAAARKPKKAKRPRRKLLRGVMTKSPKRTMALRDQVLALLG